MSFVPQTTVHPLARVTVALLFCALFLRSAGAIDPAPKSQQQLQNAPTAIFAAGCFWCSEADFEKLPGVLEVVSGYSGGRGKNPTYKNYNSGGHREVIKIAYDPNRITYSGLVEFLIKHVDPLDRGGSFVDRGTRYAAAIYYATEEEKAAAQKVIKAIDQMKVFPKPITLPILPRGEFWPAEDYHQNYGSLNSDAYSKYRGACGRDEFVKKYWGEHANELTLPDSFPNRVAPSTEELTERVQQNNRAPSDSSVRPWEQFQKPSAAALRKKLTALQFRVTQQSFTEMAFKNPYWDHHEAGIYVDVVSGEPLFSSRDKFDSGTGWPSFVRPLVPEYLVFVDDYTDRQFRIEVRSKIGNSHLGHVFSDGPQDRGGLRFCMNSASLRFIPKSKLQDEGYGDFEAALGR